jgi:hypothetical protein
MKFRSALLVSRWADFIAGWSSLVARQAHNLKVVGSNPTPATSVANVGDFAARKSVNNAIALWNESGDRLGCQKNRVDPPPREQTTNRVSFAQLANAGYIASSRMDKPISSAKGIKKAVQNYVEDLQRRSMEQVPKNASPVRLQERLKDIKAAFKNGNFPFGEIRSFQAFQSIQRQKNQLRLKKHVK